MMPVVSRIPRWIRRQLRRAALAYLERREVRRSEPPRVVWLLGHMRSGSTLLMHLLSSHPQVLGAGERNSTYTSTADLRRLAVDAAYLRRKLLRRYDWVVDQINHSRFLAAEELLDHSQVHRVFLVREPLASLASMVEVLGPLYGMTVQDAVDYYLERLPALASYARRAGDESRSFFLTYDDLVTRPAVALPLLSGFLRLRTPLSERYRCFDFTGQRGDPSPRIASGRILGHRLRQPLELEPEVEAAVREAHARCIRTLGAHCRGLPPNDSATSGRGEGR